MWVFPMREGEVCRTYLAVEGERLLAQDMRVAHCIVKISSQSLIKSYTIYSLIWYRM